MLTLQNAVSPADVASPLRVLEDALQQWAVGRGWAQRREDWLRRLERLRQEACVDPEAELLALVRCQL